jgi:phosphopantetheinyl transferase
MRTDRDTADLEEMVFTPTECQHLRSLPEKDRQETFYELWVRKEAYLKWTGRGLTGGPECVEILPDVGQHSLEEAQANRPFLASLSPADGYAGAIALEDRCSSLLCRELELA